jgi:hypothetical protein
MYYNNLLPLALIIVAASFILTNFIDKTYSFPKVTAFMLFYYALILLFAFLGNKYFKVSKKVGSIVGFIVSVLLWLSFGKKAKKV